MDDPLALIAALRLASPALPVGGYSYSQGMEYAFEDGWIAGAGDVLDWIRGNLETGITRLELPVLYRLYDAFAARDQAAVVDWNDRLLASRGSRELYLEDEQMGGALVRLLRQLDADFTAPAMPAPCAWATAYARAGLHFGAGRRQLALAFTWSWIENQVAAAVKLAPLGQGAAQRLMSALANDAAAAAATALDISDDGIGAFNCGVTLASMYHEHQYSRLFRS